MPKTEHEHGQRNDKPAKEEENGKIILFYEYLQYVISIFRKGHIINLPHKTQKNTIIMDAKRGI